MDEDGFLSDACCIDKGIELNGVNICCISSLDQFVKGEDGFGDFFLVREGFIEFGFELSIGVLAGCYGLLLDIVISP